MLERLLDKEWRYFSPDVAVYLQYHFQYPFFIFSIIDFILLFKHRIKRQI